MINFTKLSILAFIITCNATHIIASQNQNTPKEITTYCLEDRINNLQETVKNLKIENDQLKKELSATKALVCAYGMSNGNMAQQIKTYKTETLEFQRKNSEVQKLLEETFNQRL
jgi:predicted RNase H-like nuclease (RuvC/YqgF family)